MSDRIEIETFRPQVGTIFEIQNAPEAASRLELIEVKSLKVADENRDPEIRGEPFRLTFRCEHKDTYVEQQIVKLWHESLGEIDMFLVPIGPDSDGMCYEAIFN